MLLFCACDKTNALDAELQLSLEAQCTLSSECATNEVCVSNRGARGAYPVPFGNSCGALVSIDFHSDDVLDVFTPQSAMTEDDAPDAPFLASQ